MISLCRCLFFCAGLFALAWSPLAAAEPDANSEALAESLYREGKRLMAEGKPEEACPKFAESHRLSPATGTQLNLAACYQESKRWASAWTAYQAALAAASRDGRQDRVDFARARIAEVEPMLSYVTITFGGGTAPDGLVVTLDGVGVNRAAFGVPLPVDPGKHTLEAAAPGHWPWSFEVTFGEEPGRQEVQVPALEAKPEAAPPPAEETSATIAAPVAPAPEGASSTVEPGDQGVERPLTTSIYVSAGVTAALGLGAAVTGALFWNEKSQAEDARKTFDEDAYKSHSSRAEIFSNVNLGLTIGFGIGAAATTYLYFTRPAEQTAAGTPSNVARRFAVVPWASDDGGGVLVSGVTDLLGRGAWGTR